MGLIANSIIPRELIEKFDTFDAMQADIAELRSLLQQLVDIEKARDERVRRLGERL